MSLHWEIRKGQGGEGILHIVDKEAGMDISIGFVTVSGLVRFGEDVLKGAQEVEAANPNPFEKEFPQLYGKKTG